MIAGRLVLELTFLISQYGVGCDVKPDNPTASGVQPVLEHTVAADPDVLPIGSIIDIDGFGKRMVQDVGPKVRGYQIDVFVADCDSAIDWGKRLRKVKVLHRPSTKAPRRPRWKKIATQQY